MQEIKPQSPKSQIIEEEEEEQNETDDFSFASLNPNNASPISAEDAFLNGQIRAVFPIFETASNRSRVPPTPELGKIKSHSTGFSKLWRFGGDKDNIRRSSSDGKDAFLFLRNETKKKGKETVSYNHDRLYGKNRAENEKSKRKSYLPYRSNFMGFFTAPNGFNTHF